MTGRTVTVRCWSCCSDGDVPAFELDPAVDVAVLPYSSGTTGVPKGVMLTHRNLCTNLEQLNGLHRVGENDRVIAILPFFHIFGLTALVNSALRRGATVYVHARFDLDAFLTSLERDRITHAYVAPPVMLALAKHPAVGNLDLSHLRRIICAAAPLDAGLQAAVADRLGVEVGQAYGMTELSPASHIHADGNLDEPVACVGHLLPSTQARLVDPFTGLDVAAGEPGEVWIRGPQVMKGYFGRPEDTDATVDADGWLHTGDIGRVDEDGNWFIVDRVKELIKYKGYQVAPAELEAILVQHPGIADAAVIGVNDEEGNEIPKAFVVPMTGVPIIRRRGDGPRRGPGRAVQEDPPGRVHRGGTEGGLRQDPPAAAAGTGAGASLSGGRARGALRPGRYGRTQLPQIERML